MYRGRFGIFPFASSSFFFALLMSREGLVYARFVVEFPCLESFAKFELGVLSREPGLYTFFVFLIELAWLVVGAVSYKISTSLQVRQLLL